MQFETKCNTCNAKVIRSSGNKAGWQLSLGFSQHPLAARVYKLKVTGSSCSSELSISDWLAAVSTERSKFHVALSCHMHFVYGDSLPAIN